MRLLLLLVFCAFASCRCSPSPDEAERDVVTPKRDASLERSVDAGASAPGLAVVREPNLVLPVDGGLGTFVPVGDGGFIVEDFTIPRTIRRFAADMSSVWKTDILELDYPSALKVLDMIVLGDSLWMAVETDEEIQIGRRRHKPKRREQDLLVLRVSVETGEIVAMTIKRNYRVFATRFASSGTNVFLASLVGRSRVDIERIDADARPDWTISLRSPDFGRTLEFSATADAVHIVTSALNHVSVADKRIQIPVGRIPVERFVRAKLAPTGVVQELELVPVVDAVDVAVATSETAQLFLFGGDCRFIIRDANGWSMEHLFRGVRCGAPSVIVVPNGFLLVTHMLLDKSRQTWRLLFVTSSGRIMATADEAVTGGPDPFYRMQWQRDHVQSWRPEQDSADAVHVLGVTLRERTPIARWSITSPWFRSSP